MRHQTSSGGGVLPQREATMRWSRCIGADSIQFEALEDRRLLSATADAVGHHAEPAATAPALRFARPVHRPTSVIRAIAGRSFTAVVGSFIDARARAIAPIWNITIDW